MKPRARVDRDTPGRRLVRRAHGRPGPAASAALLTLALPLLVGCAARRSLRITSDPPGAMVRLDGERIGETPLEIPFEHYGVRRITLYKDQFHTHSERVEFDAPIQARFPLDILSEVLLPIGWRDKRRYHVVLVEGVDMTTTPSLRSVMERARFLRFAGPEGPRDLPDRVPAQLPEDVEPGDPDGDPGRPGDPGDSETTPPSRPPGS